MDAASARVPSESGYLRLRRHRRRPGKSRSSSFRMNGTWGCWPSRWHLTLFPSHGSPAERQYYARRVEHLARQDDCRIVSAAAARARPGALSFPHPLPASSKRDLPPGNSATGEMMSFVDEGPEAAPPLLLLHGNLTWSFLFRDLIARARGRFRVIAPDLVGFGLSSKPRDPGCYTLGALRRAPVQLSLRTQAAQADPGFARLGRSHRLSLRHGCPGEREPDRAGQFVARCAGDWTSPSTCPSGLLPRATAGPAACCANGR